MIFSFLSGELPLALLSCYFRERGEVADQKTAQVSTGGGPGLVAGVLLVGSMSAQGCLPLPPQGKTSSTARWLKTPGKAWRAPLFKKGSISLPLLGPDSENVHEALPLTPASCPDACNSPASKDGVTP